MAFAEEKTYDYIRRHHREFRHVRALEILPYLDCLTTSDQDRLRAEVERRGNADSVWHLFDSLRRRCGWVDSLVQALRDCEHTQLAEEVARVYQSYLPPPVPGPSAPAVDSRGPPNGYREEEEPSYPVPVQDTLGQSPKAAIQTPSSDTVQQGTGDQEPRSDMATRRSPTARGQPEEQDEQGKEHSGDTPTPLRGPVSPTVSFQPLSRSTSRASRLPTAPGPGTGLSPASPGMILTGAPGDQAEATIWSRGIGVPASSLPTSPSKVPINPKPPGTVPTAVPTGPSPSRLPVNSARAGTGASKVPTGLAPGHKMPTSTVPSRVPSSKGGNRAEEAPRPDSGAHWHSQMELSKPGVLASYMDSTYSGCSEDLAISRSDTGDTGGPEENEYQSGSSIRVHVSEGPSVDLMAGNPGPSTSDKFQEDEIPKKQSTSKASWAPWLMVAVAGGVLAAVLAVLHRRHLLQ